MKKFTIAASALALLILSGCGGSDGSSPSGTLTRQKVMDALTFGLEQSSNIRSGGTGTRSRVVKGTREGEEFVFSSELQLWMLEKLGVSDQPEEPTGWLFFEDEAQAKPAGHDFLWVTSNGPAMTFRTETEILAGTHVGEWHKSLAHDNGNFTGDTAGSGLYPGIGSYEFSGAWTDGGVGHWDEKFTLADESWQDYDYTSRDDGTSTLVITSSVGITFTLNFEELGGGTGSITGAADGLPATIAWDDTGTGLITWSDGTTSPFDVLSI